MAAFARRLSLWVSALIALTSALSIAITLVFVYEVDGDKLDNHEQTLLAIIEVVNWFFASIFVLTAFGIAYVLKTNPTFRNTVFNRPKKIGEVDLTTS